MPRYGELPPPPPPPRLAPPSDSAMAAVLQKRKSTDCVYFSAAPFSCTKGSECEYRHCQNARTSLKNCWYWLSGNCRNPNCTFRHPPISTLAKSLTKDVQVNDCRFVHHCQSMVPCYFYGNGYCMRGERCPFSHDENSSGGSKLNPMAVSDGYSDDGETSIGNRMETEFDEAVASPNGNKNASTLEHGEIQPYGYFATVCNSVKASSDFREHKSVARSDDEMVTYDDLWSTQLEESLKEDVPIRCIDSKSQNTRAGHDMLPNDRSYTSIPEDDCDPAYTNEIWLFGSSLQDDDDSIAECGQEVYCTPPEALDWKIADIERRLRRMKLSPRVRGFSKFAGPSLCNKRGTENGILPNLQYCPSDNIVTRERSYSSFGIRRRKFFCSLGQYCHLSQLHHSRTRLEMKKQKSLLAKLGKSHSPTMSISNTFGCVKHSDYKRVQRRSRRAGNSDGKEQALWAKREDTLSKFTFGSTTKLEPMAFARPKTLAEIKEEKQKAKDIENKKEKSGNLGKLLSAKGRLIITERPGDSFEGPKPLSELLKNKKNLAS